MSRFMVLWEQKMLSVFEISRSFEEMIYVHICVYMHLSLDDIYKSKSDTDSCHMAMVIYLQQNYIVLRIQPSYIIIF